MKRQKNNKKTVIAGHNCDCFDAEAACDSSQSNALFHFLAVITSFWNAGSAAVTHYKVGKFCELVS